MTAPLALLLAAALASGGTAQQPQDREGSVARELRVGRVEIDAYVTGSNGEPIPGLSPADFRVSIDGRPATVESAEWIPADRSEGAPTAAETTEPAAPAAVSPDAPRYAPGRLLVFFFQTDFEKSRLIGLVRMANQAHRIVETMLPTDRVAIVSYDSHLKLRQDFSGDREELYRAIFKAIKTGPEVAPDPSRFPTLAARWDERAARKAASPDRALAILASALAPLPGAKTLFFFGFGLHIRNDPKNVREWTSALRGLAAARTSLFALDVTDADFHSLETTLEVAADVTGGSYQKTHVFPQLAVSRIERAISGRYVLVVVRPDGPGGFHAVDVRLLGKKGRVNARQFYED